MNRMQAINQLIKGVQLVEVVVDVTATDGETKQLKVKVALNQLSKLQGNGLTSAALYKLKKTGTCTSEDQYGNKFVYTLGERSMSTDPVKKEKPRKSEELQKVEELQAAEETGENDKAPV